MKHILYIVLFFCSSCSFIEKPNEKINSENSLNKKNKLANQDSLACLKKLFVTGDFDGDGKLDTISQNNISDITHQQIDSYPCNQWDSIEKYFDKIEADVILTIKNKNCDTLHLGSGSGLYCLINIGDNNKDKKDEIAFVVDYHNFTNISPCDIYTLCKNKWIKLKTFDIHESAFDYESENDSDFKQIKGFLECHKNKWFYIDYMDWYNAETDKDTILRPLKIKNGC
jgi:hypothetical protein